MIKSVADVISNLIKQEKTRLEQFGPIKHGPTIGDMYEGLTQHCLNLAIPEDLNLKVVSGFIKNKEGLMSKQIDCMLVKGEGEIIPYTDKYIYRIEQVLVTVEVKKSLTQDGLKESFDNYSSYAHFVPDFDCSFKPIQNAFQLITRKTISSHQDIVNYSLQDQMIYNAIVTDFGSPVAVVMAYDGYQSELNFRRAVQKFVLDSQQSGDRKISLSLFPTLIVNGDFSLIKLNGYPFASHESDEWWNAIASYHTNSAKLLIELIWAKLSMFGGLNANAFGQDLDLEVMKPFMRMKALTESRYNLDLIGLEARHLKRTTDTIRWAPVEINQAEYTFMSTLSTKLDMKPSDERFKKLLADEGLVEKDFINSLRNKGLAYFNGEKFDYFAEEVAVAFLPNGKSYAGSNVDNRFTDWVLEETIKITANRKDK